MKLEPQGTPDYQHIDQLPTDEELNGLAEISSYGEEISTITGRPTAAPTAETPAWKQPWMPEEWDDKPTTFWGSIGNTLASGVEILAAPASLAAGTLAGINRGMPPEEAAAESWNYFTEWLGSGHAKERLMSKAVRELFMPMYPEGSPAVEAVSTLAELGLTAGPKAVLGATKTAATKMFNTLTLEKKAETVAKLQKNKKGLGLLNDKDFRDYVGTSYQFDEVSQGDIQRWSTYTYQASTEQSKKMLKLAEEMEGGVSVMRQTGEPMFLIKELQQSFGNSPMSYRTKWLDINSPADVFKDFQKQQKEMSSYISNSMKNSDWKQKTAIMAQLDKQQDYLKTRVAGDIKIQMDNIQAFTANKMLDEIDQNLFMLLQSGKDYKFASSIDRLRFYKLLAARQTLVSGITGERYPITKWLTLLDTSAPMGSQTVRKYKIALAETRIPKQEPGRAAILNEAEPLRQAQGLTTEEVSQIVKELNIPTGETPERMVAAMEDLLKQVGDPTAAIDPARYGSNLKTAKKMSVYLRELGRPTKLEKTTDTLYRARVEGALSNPFLPARTAIANGVAAARAPIYDFAASVIHMAALNPKRSMVAAGSGINRIIGAWEGAKDAFRMTYMDGSLTEYLLQTNATGRGYARSRLLADMDKKMDELNPATWQGLYDRRPLVQESTPMFVSMMPKEALQKMSPVDRAIFHIGHFAAPAMGRYAPSSRLERVDMFFKSMTYRSRLRAEAWRMASAAGKTVSDIRKLQREIMANPTDEMIAKAWGQGLRDSFQQPIEGMWRIPSKIAANVPGSRWLWMFRTSSTNAVREAMESTPVMNWFMMAHPRSRLRAMWNAGGSDRDFAIGQISVGLAALGAVMSMETEGQITGNGGLPKVGSARFNYPKYTIGGWYYGGSEVLRGTIGPLVSLKEIYTQVRDGDPEDEELYNKALWGTVMAIAEASLDRYYGASFIHTMGVVGEAIENQDLGLLKYEFGLDKPFSGVAKGFVSGARVASQYPDITISGEHSVVDRKVNELLEQTKKDMGITPENLDNIRTDLFGNPFRKSELSGYYGIRTDLSKHPIYDEINRLRPRLKDVPKSGPMGAYSPAERQAMRKMIALGKPINPDLPPLKTAIWTLMETAEYRQLSDNDKRAAIEMTINQFRILAERKYLNQ